MRPASTAPTGHRGSVGTGRANLSIATDESYLDKNSGDKVDRTEWHRIVTFQGGLVEMMEKHAKKGRLVYVSGKLQTRKWRKDGEDSDRFSTEILLVPGGRVQFLDKPNSNGASAWTCAVVWLPTTSTSPSKCCRFVGSRPADR